MGINHNILGTASFLGVDASLTGQRWVGPSDAVRRAGEALSQQQSLPAPLGTLLARLGVVPDEVDQYLNPSLRALLPDPRGLRDMEVAAERLCRAAVTRERIAIFADYDVDGGASAALLLDWLAQVGAKATLYIPDRIEEGYGPNAPAMAKLAHDHALIICVDCGTLSHEAIAAAKGADVVVLDHHLGGETLPEALAVVNPNRQDEPGDLAHLCAAAVVFLCLVEAGRQRREAGLPCPDLLAMLDLVALATVADVAPLKGVNRAFVHQGLKVMARRDRLGLRMLCDAARLETAPEAYHLGYVLGPRINAGGRIGKADLGARLLASRDPGEAQALAEKLEQLNAERREIEASVRAAALDQAASRDATALAWAAGDGWHPGVVGIAAARLKEAMHLPSVVIGFEGDEGKGSARSVEGVDLGASIQRLAQEGLITRGGGHKMAAGLTLTRAQLDPAMARLESLLAKQGAGRAGPRSLRVDGLVAPNAASVDLIESLERAGPFGAGAPGPRFVMPNMRVAHAREVGQGHLKITATDGAKARLDAIAFGAFDTPLGPALAAPAGGTFHLAGRLEINHFRGQRRVQLRLEDAARAD